MEVLIAALLHDVLEDTPTGYNELAATMVSMCLGGEGQGFRQPLDLARNNRLHPVYRRASTTGVKDARPRLLR
jgi:hypothetical protein